MKILTIAEDGVKELGDYGPACESFVDTIKKWFLKDPTRDRAEFISKNTTGALKILERHLEEDLKLTYENPKWVKNNLKDGKRLITVKALEYANVDGKAITNPTEIVKVAREMLKVISEIANVEKPYIEFRKKLIKQIQNMTDPKQVDAVYAEHADRLKETPVARFLKRGKKSYPALGFDGRKGNGWPVAYADPHGAVFFNGYSNVKTEGKIEAPTSENAKEYATAIMDLVHVILAIRDISKLCFITDAESMLEVDYNDLEYGDEIYDDIFSNLSAMDSSDVARLAWDAEYDLGHIVCGMYIAMFDSHLIARQAANEGLFDWIKNGRKLKSNPEQNYKFDTARAFGNLKAFAANPEAFTLTGRNFKESDGLILSLEGHSPRPEQLSHAFDKTVKAAQPLGVKFSRDASTHARTCKPLIQAFEKTMIDAMDREGNVDQEILDKALEPIIAAKTRVLSSYFHDFGKEQQMANTWLGGNPFNLVLQTKVNGREIYYDEFRKEVCVSVLKPDMKSLTEVAQMLLAYSDNNLPFFKEGMFDDDEDDWVDYEFDRPVRHLADMMNDTQLSAIYALYSFESNTSSLYTHLCYHMNKVYASLLKYFDMSIKRNGS